MQEIRISQSFTPAIRTHSPARSYFLSRPELLTRVDPLPRGGGHRSHVCSRGPRGMAMTAMPRATSAHDPPGRRSAPVRSGVMTDRGGEVTMERKEG